MEPGGSISPRPHTGLQEASLWQVGPAPSPGSGGEQHQTSGFPSLPFSLWERLGKELLVPH